MPRILLIDDDASLLDALSLAFEDAGHDVLTAGDGQRGLDIVKKEKPDAVISDVNMPGLDGFSLCRKLREGGNGVPFVLLTSRDDEIDEALGLELGADDYVAKPFSTRVLLARVAALLRRDAMRAAHQTERAVAKGALELFPERLEVRYAHQPVTVTVTEFRLLEAFASRAGFVLSRDRLLEIVRGDESVVAERIIDTYVRMADSGALLGTARATMVIRGQGGFGGPQAPVEADPWVKPERAPDVTIVHPTSLGQSLIYRHSGDNNPHCTDPARARADGFERPIFQGLGTFGFACRALLQGVCDGDVERFRSMSARLSNPVFPGETLTTQIWRIGESARFQTLGPDGRLLLDRGTFSAAS